MTTIPGNTSTNATINPNQTISETINFADDSDWFRTGLSRGLTYGLFLEGDGGANSLQQSNVSVFTVNGVLIDFDEGFSGTAYLPFTPVATATYFIGAAGRTSSFLGDYELRLVARDNIVNDTATQVVLAPNVARQHAVDVAGDLDMFKVTMNAGITYGVNLSGTGTNTQLVSTHLRILDTNGTELATQSAFSGPSHIGFTPSTTGTYFVLVGEFGDNGSGDYRLFMDGQDTVRADVNTTTGLPINSAVASRIDTQNDEDFYRVVLQAGQQYTIRLEGDGSADSLRDTAVGIYDAAGNPINTDSSFNGPSQILFTPAQSGTFYVVASERGTDSTGSYILTVSGNANPITGGAGNDTLFGDAGANNLFGFGGNDLLIGLEANDILDGGADGDIIIGGLGTDTATYRTSTAGVSIELLYGNTSGGDAQGDTLLEIENLQGSDFADTLLGDHGNNAIWGLDANDVIAGRQGMDMIDGGGGGDQINGGGDADTIYGRNGADTINGDAGNDTIFGGNGFDTIRGNAGNDTIEGEAGDDMLFGGSGTDTLRGGANNDRLAGGDWADMLYGNSGNDVLLGENGMDTLFGNVGNDRLNGGAGSDTLQGDNGNDVFVIASGTGNDTITDMQAGDRIDFSNNTLVNNFAQVQPRASQQGSDVFITLGTDSVTLQNFLLGNLDASDFLF